MADCAQGFESPLREHGPMPRFLLKNANVRSGRGLFVGVEPEIDDVPHAESADVRELLLGGLAGCRYAIIETTPVVDHFRIDHGAPLRLKLGPRTIPGPAHSRQAAFKRPSCWSAVTPSSRPTSSAILPFSTRTTVVPVNRILRPDAAGREPIRKSLNAGPVCVPPPSHRPTT